jgi:hypothetical protein
VENRKKKRKITCFSDKGERGEEAVKTPLSTTGKFFLI